MASPKLRRASPRGAFSIAGSASQQARQRGEVAAVGEGVEVGQDAGHGPGQRAVARIGGERADPDQAVAEAGEAVTACDHGAGSPRSSPSETPA